MTLLNSEVIALTLCNYVVCCGACIEIYLDKCRNYAKCYFKNNGSLVILQS